MSHFITDDAISRLPENENLGKQDLFVVSKKGSGEKYTSTKVSYDQMANQLQRDFDIDGLRSGVQANRRDIDQISADVDAISVELDDLSTRFLENDALTKLIPDISAELSQLLNDSMFFQKIDSLEDLGTGTLSVLFEPQDSAVNKCRMTQRKAYIRMPQSLSDEAVMLSNRSRHLIVDVSSEVSCQVRFSNNCKYYSDSSSIVDPLEPDSHTLFIFKEIRPNVMYVQRQNVVSVYSGTDMDQLLAAIYYHKSPDSNEYGVELFDVQANKRVMDYAGMLSISSDISANVADGEYFQGIYDVTNPGSLPMTISAYPQYRFVKDTILSAKYGSSPVFSLYFFGNLSNMSSGGQGGYKIVDSFYPVFYGDNLWSRQKDATYRIGLAESAYISSDQYFMGWAKSSLSGGICRVEYKTDWDTDSTPAEFRDAEYYAIGEWVDGNLDTLVGPFNAQNSVQNMKIMPDGDTTPLSDDVFGSFIQIEDDEEDINGVCVLRLISGDFEESGGEDSDNPIANLLDTVGVINAPKIDSYVFNADR